MEFISLDFIAVIAILVSFIAVTERWRTTQRARQEANILILSSQINDSYSMMDENIIDVLMTDDKKKLRNINRKNRMLMLQKIHVHLDALEVMIKMETKSFMNRVFGKRKSVYYRELISWYCSVNRFYNYLIDVMGIEDTGFFHDGRVDPHRTGGKLPKFLENDKYAKKMFYRKK